MSNPFASLPNELLISVALSLSSREIYNLCQTDQRFNELICDNQYFWQHKFYHDYGKIVIQSTDWKTIYQKFLNVWGFGNNKNGQLGNIKTTDTPTVINDFKAKSIFAGFASSAFIDVNNNAWVFGRNSTGELGLGDKNKRYQPTLLPYKKVKQIAFKYHHMALIDLQNNVWTCGLNMFGSLGLGISHFEEIIWPKQIPQIKAQQVSVGGEYTILIDLDNNIWGFGINSSGQLGLGDIDETPVPVQLPLIKALQVSVGDTYTVIIDLNNNVWACGWDEHGQLGLGLARYTRIKVPTQIPDIKAQQVSCGKSHTILIDLDNNVWVCGRNDQGQLGLGDTENRNQLTLVPTIKARQVSAGLDHTVVIDMEYNIWMFGNTTGINQNKYLVPTKLTGLKAAQVAAGYQFTLMLATTSI